jgi:hypothetical protein
MTITVLSRAAIADPRDVQRIDRELAARVHERMLTDHRLSVTPWKTGGGWRRGAVTRGVPRVEVEMQISRGIY